MALSSLRLEIEQCLGLKFPEQNGEPVIKFEESMEIPRAAETLMRGLYRDPDRTTRGFQSLHQETASLLDLLLPRRSRLREWAENLPEQPKEAEKFIKDTSEVIKDKSQRLSRIESELLSELGSTSLNDLFPVSLSAFGQCTYRDPAVKIYLRPLGRLAELMQLNPEQLRMAVRIYFLFLFLLWTGLDLDGQGYRRSSDDPMVHTIVGAYTTRFLLKQSSELLHCYQEWNKAWGGKTPPQALMEDNGMEKLRTAVVFWRRQSGVSWEYCWELVCQLEKSPISGGGQFVRFEDF